MSAWGAAWGNAWGTSWDRASVPVPAPGGGGDRRARLRRLRLIQSGNAPGSTITVAISVLPGMATGGVGPLKVLADLDLDELALIRMFTGSA
jgi:hypothetical protein